MRYFLLALFVVSMPAKNLWADDFTQGLAREFSPEFRADYAGAAEHYQKAAQAGSRDALFRLFKLYAPNGPLWRDMQSWRPWLTAAADAGWPEAAFALGRALEENQLTPQDVGHPAEYYYRLAAESSYPPAAFKLGQIYLAVPERQQEALVWLALAAESAHSDAALALGKFYSGKDSKLAGKWLEKDSRAEARFLLGQLYLSEKRTVEAETVFTQAAAQGYPQADLALGLLALEPQLGRPVNQREALKRLKIAAAADLPEGAYQLARMYLAGQATPKDPITAAYWFNRAKVRGHEKASQDFSALTMNFTKGQQSRLNRMITDDAPPLSH